MSKVIDTKKSIFGVNSVKVSYLVHYGTLLQSATAILSQNTIKSLLQNGLGFLLQNVTVSLQIATVITKCVNFITKCNRFYKIQRLLQKRSINSSMNIKRLAALCVELYKTINKLNPNFMRHILKLQLTSRPVRKNIK